MLAGTLIILTNLCGGNCYHHFRDETRKLTLQSRRVGSNTDLCDSKLVPLIITSYCLLLQKNFLPGENLKLLLCLRGGCTLRGCETSGMTSWTFILARLAPPAQIHGPKGKKQMQNTASSRDAKNAHLGTLGWKVLWRIILLSRRRLFLLSRSVVCNSLQPQGL